MKNKLLIFCICILLFACKSNKNIIDVQNVNVRLKYSPTGLFYSLPKTKIIVVVEVEKIIKNKGPYSEYTKTYLGAINNVIEENSTVWQIASIKFYDIPIVDTSNIYVVNSKNYALNYAFNLTKEGFLVSYNNALQNSYEFDLEIEENNYLSEKGENSSFNILTSDKNYKIIYDTIYREEVYDTIIRKIPILKKNVILKTPEEQAKDLAEQILLLRDDRNALLVGEGDSDYLPDGEALTMMLKGIEELEKNYLSMFVGRTDIIKFTYTYSYIPEKESVNKIMLFKFSEQNGIYSTENLTGTPVYLEIVSENNTQNIFNYQKSIKNYESLKKIKYNKGIYYRVPEKALVKVNYKNFILAQKNIFIPQLGTIENLPAQLFKNNNLIIDFYPNLGSIKKIEYKTINN